MRLFREKYVTKHASAGNTLTDCTFMRRIVVLVVSVLLCVAAMGVTAYALFYHGVTTAVNQITTADYALSLSLDSAEAETVYMSSAGKTYVFDEAGTHTLAISTVSEENLAPTGFCIITRNDTDENDDSRTTNFYTTQLGTGGSNSLTLTLYVLSAGSVTVKPHWGTYSNYGYISGYTAVNSSQIDIGTAAVTYNTFTHSDNFANVDVYLYRVGNGNTVALGSLFKSNGDGDNAVNAANVKITVAAVESEASVYGSGSNLQSGSSGKCTYTINTSDWTASTLEFTGEGPVRVTISEGSGEEYTLNLEVVDARNATTATSATSYNVVLLNDVSSNSLSITKRFYGNGFTVADTRTADSDDTIGMSKAFVYVDGGIVDNVYFKGYEPTTQVALGNTLRQSAPAVRVYGTNPQLYNCHISGGRYAVYFYNATDAYMESSVIDGGAVGGIGISGAYVTLKDCVTTLSTQGGLKGAGIHVPAVLNGHLTILGTFEQHNWVQKSDLPNLYQSLVSDMYSDSELKYVQDGKTYINAGIFFMSDANAIDEAAARAFITDENDGNYAYKEKTSSGYTGTMRSAKASSASPEMLAVADTSTTQYGVIPTYTFDFTTKNYKEKVSGDNNYCYYDSTLKQVMISYDKETSDTTFSWDPDILTVTKFGCSLTSSYSISPASGWTASNGKILFADEGDYTVTYTYTDPYNYHYDLTSDIKTYTKTVSINVVYIEPEAVVYHPVFTYASDWSSYSAKQIIINNDTYVMPDVSATSSTIGSTTVSGQTIYYPIVTVEGKNSSGGSYSSGKIYCFAPAFSAINIEDLNADTGATLYTYNSSTKTWPHNIAASNGPGSSDYYGPASTRDPYGAGTGADYEKYAYNSNNGGLCYTSNEIERNITAKTTLVKFHYTGNDGITYYYYIQYSYSAVTYKSGGSCLTEGTLITLADGTQKKVEDLTGTEQLLVWNLETGIYDSAPIVFVDSDPAQDYEIMHVCFSDGTDVEVAYEHGFFDLTLGRYVYINESTMNDYIGHEFITLGNVLGNTLNSAILTHVWTENKTVSVYSPVTFEHLCYYADGVLSMPGGIEGLFNIFEVDTETMAYDPAKKQADIEAYGLLTTDDYAGMITEYMFNAFNGQYLAVAVGKGQLTWDYIAYLAERYAPLCE